MDVELYVYDLSRGMARAMSKSLMGIQIDAIYHTSLVFGQIEYFFGAGVQTCRPGTTHHGQPMQKVHMGTTHLPLETILDYLESLKAIYTPESYDLFAHNCNNFTADFSMFLVGKTIPDYISSMLPQIMSTPFGQMIKPQIEQSVRNVTQAPLPASSVVVPGSSQSAHTSKPIPTQPATAVAPRENKYGSVVQVTSLPALQNHLQKAADTASCIFFTSSTCAPCRLAYPTFDSLAAQHPRALFIKVDINSAHEIASKYEIRATPTFMTWSRTRKQDEWQGADPSTLKMNVERLIEATFPSHPHSQLKIPTLQFGSLKPITYARLPPLDKLVAKLGDAARQAPWRDIHDFVKTRSAADPSEARIPDLLNVVAASQEIDLSARFAAIDLLRCAAIDVRVTGFLAEGDAAAIVPSLIRAVTSSDETPHNLRLVTIHLASNVFNSPVYVKEITTEDGIIATALVELIVSSLLDHSHPTTRVAAASLAFNLATSNYRVRREENREALAEGLQVELAASLIETLSGEENPDAIKALLTALGYLVYYCPRDGDVLDTCKALDARATILKAGAGQTALAKEVATLMS